MKFNFTHTLIPLLALWLGCSFGIQAQDTEVFVCYGDTVLLEGPVVPNESGAACPFEFSNFTIDPDPGSDLIEITDQGYLLAVTQNNTYTVSAHITDPACNPINSGSTLYGESIYSIVDASNCGTSEPDCSAHSGTVLPALCEPDVSGTFFIYDNDGSAYLPYTTDDIDWIFFAGQEINYDFTLTTNSCPNADNSVLISCIEARNYSMDLSSTACGGDTIAIPIIPFPPGNIPQECLLVESVSISPMEDIIGSDAQNYYAIAYESIDYVVTTVYEDSGEAYCGGAFEVHNNITVDNSPDCGSPNISNCEIPLEDYSNLIANSGLASNEYVAIAEVDFSGEGDYIYVVMRCPFANAAGSLDFYVYNCTGELICNSTECIEALGDSGEDLWFWATIVDVNEEGCTPDNTDCSNAVAAFSFIEPECDINNEAAFYLETISTLVQFDPINIDDLDIAQVDGENYFITYSFTGNESENCRPNSLEIELACIYSENDPGNVDTTTVYGFVDAAICQGGTFTAEAPGATGNCPLGYFDNWDQNAVDATGFGSTIAFTVYESTSIDYVVDFMICPNGQIQQPGIYTYNFTVETEGCDDPIGPIDPPVGPSGPGGNGNIGGNGSGGSTTGDCANHSGIIFYETCDDGTDYFFIQLADGTILDPYYDAGIDFADYDGQPVNFDYVPTGFESGCSIADLEVTITCIEQDGDFATDEIIYACVGETVQFDPPYAEVPCYISDTGGPIGPPTLVWTPANVEQDNSIVASHTMYYTAVSTYVVYCNSIPDGPQGPATISTETKTFLVIVVDNCDPVESGLAPGVYDLDGCVGDVIELDISLAPPPGQTFNPCNGQGSLSGDLQNINGQSTLEGILTLDVLNGAGTVTYTIGLIGPDILVPCQYEWTFNISIGNLCDDTSTDQVFNNFNWLSSVVDPNNCQGVYIDVYDLGTYAYVMVNTPFGNSLYFEDGSFYCSDAPGFSCVSAYGLGSPTASWTCGETIVANCTSPANAEDFVNSLDYEFLTDVFQIQNMSPNNILVYEIDLDGTYYYGVTAYCITDVFFPVLYYYCDGTRYCPEPFDDCISLDSFPTTVFYFGDCLLPQESEVFNDYPFLNNLVNTSNCDGDYVEVYNLGTYAYIYVYTNGEGSLYFQDGTYYCGDAPGFSCVAAYGLGSPTDTWECGEGTTPPGSNQIFSEYPFLSNLVDQNNCDGISITAYASGSTFYLIIAGPEGTDMYNASGQYYCGDYPGFSCAQAYGLTEVVSNWTCGDVVLPPTDPILQDYPWLDEIFDNYECPGITVTLYDGFIFVDLPDGGELYLADGTFWCGDWGTLSCVEAYGLTNGSVIWECPIDSPYNPGDDNDWEVNEEGSQNRMSHPTVTENPLAIEELELKAFPNPSNGRFQVELAGNDDQEMLLNVYNLQGSLIESISIESDNARSLVDIDLSDVDNGIYIVELISSYRSTSQRIVISR